MKNLLIKMSMLVLFSPNLFGQDEGFKLMRFDEDYTYLKDSTRNFYESLKYIPLSEDKNISLSVGGEARGEFIHFKNEDWGSTNIGTNPFFLQRYSLHADLKLGNRVRVFTQIRSAWESGRKNGPRPIDEDHANIQNLFVDVDVIKDEKQQLTARVGRQELNYGSGRLISVREGPNLRLYFDGAKVMYKRGNFSSDAFIMAQSTVTEGAFDNSSTKKANLWGSYNTFTLPKETNLDVYYIGVHRDEIRYEDQFLKETRHTIGTRIWRDADGFIYNFEAAYQFGKVSRGRINAYTVSMDAGYSFAEAKGEPTVSLRVDYISGDQKTGDGKLQSFNPLFPKGGYFGFSPQVGPVNLFDIKHYETINLNDKMTLQGDVVFNWRASLNDGVYKPSGNLSLASNNSRKRYIGTAFLGSFTYNINKHFTSVTGIQYFKTGDFINDVIENHKDGVFFNTKLTFKF